MTVLSNFDPKSVAFLVYFIIDSDHFAVFPVKFQLWGFVPLTTKKWGYKEKNRGTKQN